MTKDGRPVARLVPIPRSGPADALLESGLLSPAAGDLLDIGVPLEPRSGVALPSAELSAIREGER